MAASETCGKLCLRCKKHASGNSANVAQLLAACGSMSSALAVAVAVAVADADANVAPNVWQLSQVSACSRRDAG